MIEKDFAAIGPGGMITTKDFDEGAFARAIFPTKRVNLTLFQVEGNPVQSLYA